MASQPAHQTEDPLHKLQRRLWIERAVLLALLAIFAGLYIGALPGGRRVCLISADDRPVTVVPTRGDAQRMLRQLKSSFKLPADKLHFGQRITFHLVSAARHPVQPDGEALDALAAELDVTARGAAVLANGEPIIALPDQAEAVRALSLILEEYSPSDPDVTTYFKEQVKVEMRDVPPDLMATSADDALQKIAEETAPRAEHKAKPGQSAWKIARDYHVSLKRLAYANPDVDLDHLRVGDRITIPGGLPPLTVMAKKEIEEPVGEGASARYEKVRITYENGMEVKREVIGRRPGAVLMGPPQGRGEEDPWRWRDQILER